jgi:hypothetical protein
MISTQLQIKTRIQDLCQSHKMVNETHYGFLTDIDDLPQFVPVTIYIVPGPTTSPRDGIIRYKFSLVCFDLLKDDKSNLDTVLSDTQTILLDIFSALMYLDQESWTAQSGITITPFQERLKDYTAGNTLDIFIDTFQSNCLSPKPFA